MQETRTGIEALVWMQCQGFVDVGQLNVENEELKYSCNQSVTEGASCYVVIATALVAGVSQAEVWYVGSTFAGWKKRFRDQNGGLKRAKKLEAGKRSKVIYGEQLKFLQDGGNARVFERLAGHIELFGRRTANHEAEESIFIDILNPRYNRQKCRRSEKL